MKGSQTFSEILKARMKTPVSENKAGLFIEENQTLWVQILPFVSREKWTFPGNSKYPRSSQRKISTPPPSPKTGFRPAASPKPELHMSVEELGMKELAQWELLVRRGWVPRKQSYSLSEWKQAHRKAVRRLHPDTRSSESTDSFSEVHEGFKALKSCFKASSSIDAVYDTESASAE